MLYFPEASENAAGEGVGIAVAEDCCEEVVGVWKVVSVDMIVAVVCDENDGCCVLVEEGMTTVVVEMTFSVAVTVTVMKPCLAASLSGATAADAEEAGMEVMIAELVRRADAVALVLGIAGTREAAAEFATGMNVE